MSDSAQKMIAELHRIERGIYRDVRDAMVSEGEGIMTRSQNEFAPKDEGDLINSGTVSLVEDGTIGGLEVIMSYGDEKTNTYVLAVHESPSGYDPPTWQGKEVKFNPSGRGPKFLEKPLFEAENGMIQRIASNVRL